MIDTAILLNEKDGGYIDAQNLPERVLQPMREWLIDWGKKWIEQPENASYHSEIDYHEGGAVRIDVDGNVEISGDNGKIVIRPMFKKLR